MKSFFFVFILFLLNQCFASTPVLKKVEITGVFTPESYSSVDNAKLVISGYLPNSCHKRPKITKQILNYKIEITVSSLHYGEVDSMCPESETAFVEVISFRPLKKGIYDVVVNKGSENEFNEILRISDSSEFNKGENIYANVQYIERSVDKRTVILKGHNPSDCYILEQIQVLSNGSNTITILPRMKKQYDLCTMKMTPFSYEVEVPNNSVSEESLIHVRRMHGDSINRII